MADFISEQLRCRCERKIIAHDETIPGGDGYVGTACSFHADGKTSTALFFENVTQTNDDAAATDSNQTARPSLSIGVTLNFRADANACGRQWTEISITNPGAVDVGTDGVQFALLTTNVYLTHFFGDWVKKC